MAGTDWQEGTELNDGRPDRDYVGNYISLWVTDVAWMCSIKWGTTWGHITFAEGNTAVEAMETAATQAAERGAPLQWLPGYDITDPRA